MNGTKMLLDSNILIYLSKKEIVLSEFVKPDSKLYISVITYMEVLGYPFSSKKEEKVISTLCDSLNVIYLDDEIVKEVIKIRRKDKIKLPDAIIAASAIVKNIELVTRNTEDFKSLAPGLTINNPFD